MKDFSKWLGHTLIKFTTFEFFGSNCLLVFRNRYVFTVLIIHTFTYYCDIV